MIDPSPALERLLEILSSFEIPYMIGGSLASSVHGIPRSTNDIDLVADLPIPVVRPLAAAVRSEFYIDRPEAVEQAIGAGRMFNLIHFASSFKFDIHPLSPDPYHQAAFARRKMEEYSFQSGWPVRSYVCSAEDSILAKLSPYRASKQVLERQWSDVLDVVRVTRDKLDESYLRQWATPLGVAGLLEEALRTT